MKRISLVALALVAGSLSAQEVKVNALVDLWYNQVIGRNLRVDKQVSSNVGDASATTPAYYNLNSAFTENGFTIRRAEIYLSGKVIDDLAFNVVFDPNLTTSTTNPTIVHDAFLTYNLTKDLYLRAGQFKPLQTYEATLQSANDLLFYDRSQLARVFGDKRDRGIVASYGWGDTSALYGRVNVGFFNGSTDRDGGKAVDANAQKDYATRIDFGYGKFQKFGFYGKVGSTDTADKNGLVASTFTYAGTKAPTAAQILENKDKTTDFGVYYNFENEHWVANAEAITGLLGRRFASVGGTSGSAALRQHLDQKFFGFVLTGAYRVGRHTFGLRYDYLNYNQGDKFYGPYNPYTQNTTSGASLGADYTPKYTEVVAGWTYALHPAKWKLANLKVNYIHRSDNFLRPSQTGQTGEQGGDNVVVALQVGF